MYSVLKNLAFGRLLNEGFKELLRFSKLPWSIVVSHL